LTAGSPSWHLPFSPAVKGRRKLGFRNGTFLWKLGKEMEGSLKVIYPKGGTPRDFLKAILEKAGIKKKGTTYELEREVLEVLRNYSCLIITEFSGAPSGKPRQDKLLLTLLKTILNSDTKVVIVGDSFSENFLKSDEQILRRFTFANHR